MQADASQWLSNKVICAFLSSCAFYQRDIYAIVCTHVAIAVERHSDHSEGKQNIKSHLREIIFPLPHLIYYVSFRKYHDCILVATRETQQRQSVQRRNRHDDTQQHPQHQNI